jgi:hypothetical protein
MPEKPKLPKIAGREVPEPCDGFGALSLNFGFLPMFGDCGNF